MKTEPATNILPIHVYNDPVLRQEAAPVTPETPGLASLIDQMIETMHGAAGIGLAAPQVGHALQLFVVDIRVMLEDGDPVAEQLPPQPMVFLNPALVEEFGDDVEFEEGCLSIPDIREVVVRPEGIVIEYLDRDFQPQELEATGLLARVIQHEYDHLEGVLFIDLISNFRRRLLRRRLREMAQGNVDADYPLQVRTRKA